MKKPTRLPNLPRGYAATHYPVPARRRAKRFFANLVAALKRWKS